MKSKQIELTENMVLVGGASGYAEERDSITWKLTSKAISVVDPDPALNVYDLTFADNNKELVYSGDVDLTITGFTTMPDGAIFAISNNTPEPHHTIKFQYHSQTVYLDYGRAVLVTVCAGNPRIWYDYSAENKYLQFTGDGTTTSFNLSESPLLSDFGLVWMNGDLQVPHLDYLINPSGHSLDFTVAPANGADIRVVFDNRKGVAVKMPIGYKAGLEVTTDPTQNLVEVTPGMIVTSNGTTIESDRSYGISTSTINERDGFYPSVVSNQFYCVFICYSQAAGNFIRVEASSQPSQVATMIDDYAYLGMVYVDDTGNLANIINPMVDGDYCWLGTPVTVYNSVDIPVVGQRGVLLTASDFKMPTGMQVQAKVKLRASTNYNFNSILASIPGNAEAIYTYLQLLTTKVTTDGQIFENVTDMIPFTTTDGLYLNQGNIDTTAHVTGVDANGSITQITVTNTAYGLTSVDIEIVGDGFGATAYGELTTDASNRKYLAPGPNSIHISNPGQGYTIENTGVKIIEHGGAASLNSFEMSIVAFKAKPISSN